MASDHSSLGDDLGDGLEGYAKDESLSEAPPEIPHLRVADVDDYEYGLEGEASSPLHFDERDPYGFDRRSTHSSLDYSESYVSCRESSDGDRSSNASYHTAQQQHSDAGSKSGTDSLYPSEFNVRVDDFITCRDENDLSSHRDFSSMHSDDDTFYECGRFNEQGLRSVLAVPTSSSANPGAQFNIQLKYPLNKPPHVVGNEVKEHSPKQTECKVPRRRQRTRITIVALVMLVACATVAGVLLAPHQTKNDNGSPAVQVLRSETQGGVRGTTIAAPSAAPRAHPSAAPLASPPASPPAASPAFQFASQPASPSVSPSEMPTARPSFVFASGNFTQSTRSPSAGTSTNSTRNSLPHPTKPPRAFVPKKKSPERAPPV